ncbi:MAG: LysR family transcriptional regulator [Epsilonproteobacteria bacterium]|nr:LysR family transcriptional regulator [Campylobacterota bacterium]
MTIYDLSLRHIFVFNNVAETLNMSKSAKNLFITQSAVSQTIKDIENKFAIKLFIRQNKKLYLTHEGKELYICTKKIINLLKDAQLCLENFNTLKKGCACIGASTTIGNYLLPVIVKAFKEQYPCIDIKIFIGNTNEVINKLRLSDIDVGLIEGLPQTNDTTIKTTKFMEDELIFVCSPQHHFAKKRTVGLKELKSENFIIREKGSGTRQIIETEFERHGVNVNISYEFNNSEAIKNAVSCNLGISVLSKLIVKKELSANMLKKINIKGLTIYRWFYLLKTDACNKAQKVLIEHILENAKDFYVSD